MILPELDQQIQEARIWAILEPAIVAGDAVCIEWIGDRWRVMMARRAVHYGATRLDALAQLAQAEALR